jgi:hypothetical protein
MVTEATLTYSIHTPVASTIAYTESNERHQTVCVEHITETNIPTATAIENRLTWKGLLGSYGLIARLEVPQVIREYPSPCMHTSMMEPVWASMSWATSRERNLPSRSRRLPVYVAQSLAD